MYYIRAIYVDGPRIGKNRTDYGVHYALVGKNYLVSIDADRAVTFQTKEEAQAVVDRLYQHYWCPIVLEILFDEQFTTAIHECSIGTGNESVFRDA